MDIADWSDYDAVMIEIANGEYNGEKYTYQVMLSFRDPRMQLNTMAGAQLRKKESRWA